MNFQNINNAYNILSDETSRNYYDVYGKDFEAMKEYFDEIIHSYNIPELYALKKNISILYRKNYEKILLNSPYIWIVTFYHPNCGSCQQNVPIITALAEVVATGDKIRVGVMNCAVSIHLCHTFNIDHMGQIVFFPPYQEANDFWDYVKYAGYNSVSNIMQHALNLSHGEIVKIDNEMYIPQQLMQPIHSSITKGLVEGIWLLEYYKVGCSPCKQLKTELNALSQTLKGTLKISTINCGEHLCNVPFYPYLKLFIKRAGSNKIETIPLKYETDGHPGALAISITGIILKDVIGLQWRRKNEKFNKIKNEKKDTHRFEEL